MLHLVGYILENYHRIYISSYFDRLFVLRVWRRERNNEIPAYIKLGEILHYMMVYLRRKRILLHGID